MNPPFNHKDIWIILSLIIVMGIGVLTFVGISNQSGMPEGKYTPDLPLITP